MKNVIITGAAGNLGTEVTEYFLEKGYRVIATVLNDAEADRLESGTDHRERLTIEVFDLTNEKTVPAFAGPVIGQYGAIHGVLLLAGGFAMGDIRATSLQDIKSQLSINFDTAYPMARTFFSHLMERGEGRLVFVGTRPALNPADGKHMIAYALAKSLLFRLSEQLNAAAAGTKVVSTVVVPSTIDTPTNREAMPQADFGKWVKPRQIAELLHLVCSETGAPLRETVLKVYGES